MKILSIAEAKNTLPELIHQVERGEPIQIARRGQVVAALLSEVEYQRLKSAAAASSDFARWAHSWRAQLPPDFEGLTQDEISRWREL